MFNKIYSLNQLLLILSAIIILVTAVLMPFNREDMSTLCYCVPNQMAYGWIAYGLGMLIGMLNHLMMTFDESETVTPGNKYMLIVSALAFMTGIVFTILFGVYVNDLI